MGRGKIEIKRIEDANARQVTFSKRRNGLLKKAQELAILCDADVAVIIFSNTGKFFEFSSSGMKEILSRYSKCVSAEAAFAEQKIQGECDFNEANFSLKKEENEEVHVLKEEMAKLERKQLYLLGKDLIGLGLKELQNLEQQLSEGLFYVKERKEEVLYEQLQHSRVQEQRAMLENETLRRQVEELRCLVPLKDRVNRVPSYFEYYPPGRRNSLTRNGVQFPDFSSNYSRDKEDSDTTLHLGLATDDYRKRKELRRENISDISAAQVAQLEPNF